MSCDEAAAAKADEAAFGTVTTEHKRSWSLPGDLEKWVMGDIAGAFVEEDDRAMPPKVRAKWETACSRWSGVTRSDFKECAKRSELSFLKLVNSGENEKVAAMKCLPGTVVISTGGDARARLLIRLVDLGMVNTIICDYSLRRALEERSKRLRHPRPGLVRLPFCDLSLANSQCAASVPE